MTNSDNKNNLTKTFKKKQLLFTYHPASQRLEQIGTRVVHLVLAIVVAVVHHRVSPSTSSAAAHRRRSVCAEVRRVCSTAEVRNEEVYTGVRLQTETKRQIKISGTLSKSQNIETIVLKLFIIKL